MLRDYRGLGEWPGTLYSCEVSVQMSVQMSVGVAP